MKHFLRAEFKRSKYPDDDEFWPGKDFGRYVTLYIRGKHRLCWHSTRGTTRMWPRVVRGSDENCNRSVTLVLWPIGHLDIWWETKWRTDEDGICAECRASERGAGWTPT